jgi:hypothetical protein
MAKKNAEPRPNLKGLDMQSFQKLLESAGDAAPYVFSFVQQLVQTLQARQQGMKAAPACPSEHLHGCCQKALEHACLTVSELIACADCCCPDEEPAE